MIMGNLRRCHRVSDSVTYVSTLPSSSPSAALHLAHSDTPRRGPVLTHHQDSVLMHYRFGAVGCGCHCKTPIFIHRDCCVKAVSIARIYHEMEAVRAIGIIDR